jgi:hypothetical protein
MQRMQQKILLKHLFTKIEHFIDDMISVKSGTWHKKVERIACNALGNTTEWIW